MLRSAALFLGFLAAGLIRAQATNALSISGTVLEIGSDGVASLPVGGAEVSLIEFVPVGGAVTRSPVATAYTDPHGAYQFRPEHAGNYYIEVKKEGYRYSAASFYGIAVKLDQAPSAAQSSFTLTRGGASISGRVVDQDGQPVADLRIAVQSPGVVPFNVTNAVTAADGSFTIPDLLPGPRVVRISPRAGQMERVEPHFSPGDLQTVDQDFEATFWPGGATRQTASIPVSPGAAASVGTIRVRKVPYYRVHVSVPRVECEAGEKWTLSVVNPGEGAILRGSHKLPCVPDFLISNLRPGSYSLTLRRDATAPGRWASASLDISNKNSEVTVSFQPESQISGRFVAAEGAALPMFDKIRVSAPSEVGASASQIASPDAEGKFVLAHMEFALHRIEIQGLPPQYYVKEIRFNGAPAQNAPAGATVPGPHVVLAPGPANQMEIVIDDKPGTISGTVTEGDNPVAEATVRLYPKVPPLARDSVANVRTDQLGRFEIHGLTPGEYQVLALPLTTGPIALDGYADAVAQLAAHAPSVTVERGGTAILMLPLSRPLR